MLDVHRLQILLRFAALGSIAATAVDLGYSASAISQQLAALEREAGVALIERTAQRAFLTDAGRELADLAYGIVDAAETAQSRMLAHAGQVSGVVEIACIPGVAIELAPPLAALQRTHPDLHIVARETGSAAAVAAVLDGTVDIAVVDSWDPKPSPPPSGLTIQQVRREEIVLATLPGHPGKDRDRKVTAAAVRAVAQQTTWLSAPPGQLSRAATDAWIWPAGKGPRLRWEFEGMHVLAALVAGGAGVALLPRIVIADHPRVIGQSLQPARYRHIVSMSRTSSQRNPTLQSCRDAIRLALGPTV